MQYRAVFDKVTARGQSIPRQGGAAVSASPVAHPCGQSAVVLRDFVTKVVVRQQRYLKGGLRRRCLESLIILPLSHIGVSLCASFAP